MKTEESLVHIKNHKSKMGLDKTWDPSSLKHLQKENKI